MQKVIEKSLTKAILEDIWNLNQTNAEMYAIMAKLSWEGQTNKESFIPKLEVMKAEISHQISQLTSNVDDLFRTMDKKIGILITKMSKVQKIEQQLFLSQSRITQLEEKIHQTQINLNEALYKNKDLAYQNQLLEDRLQKMSQKFSKKNDCRMASTKNTQESILSVQSPFSKTGVHLSKNNMSLNEINFHKNSLKCEENSFSQMLAKEMSTMDQSLPPTVVQNSRIFKFGCSSNTPNFNKPEQDPNLSQGNQSHRLKYLLQNLKNSMEGQSSSLHHHNITSQHDKGWGERKVKKYNI